MRDWSYLYASKPEGARALLSTIAGSMIGVAGVTFSITIAAVAYASSSFGPRILTSFMRDTGNQVTLGTFIATYVYCLLILRTVRSGDETLFVPHLSVLFGVAMALASLAVLIFFIHHIPRSIHVGNVVAEIGREMLRKADSLYPEEGQDSSPSPSVPAPVESAEGEAVRSEHTGYVQTVDLEGLRGLAEKHKLRIFLRVRPGDFVTDATDLARVEGAEDDNQGQDVLKFLIVGDDRSAHQDLFFLIEQQVDLAVRSLSKGINDPFTAMSAADWLGALLGKLGRKTYPTGWVGGADGQTGVNYKSESFRQYVEAVWDRLRPYLETDPNAALYMLDRGLATVEELPPARRPAVAAAMGRLLEGCSRCFQHSGDLAALEERRRGLESLSQVVAPL